MTKRIADLICPECNKNIQVPFEVEEPPTLDEISNSLQEALKGHLGTDEIQKVIRDQLEGLKPSKEVHKHKTADEFFDCPECSSWVKETAQRYQVSPKEPEKEPEPEPEPKGSAIGSIFSAETGD